MKEKYLINKNDFIHEYEKFYDHQWSVLKEFSMHTFFVGKCGKYEIHCNFNKEWFLYNTDTKNWIEIEPIMLPSEVYKRDKNIFHFQNMGTLNDIEILLIDEGATDEMITDLCELTDMLNNYINKNYRQNYID